MWNPPRCFTAASAAALLFIAAVRAEQAVFKSGIDLVNVTATVTGGDGRFIGSLRKEDFVVTDNGQPQEILNFSSERVPVSLGMLLDVSGSMTDEKMRTARAAINHFIYDLLSPDDELFLAEFSLRAQMLQTWTQNRDTFSRALDRANKGGFVFGTAVYDSVAMALPIVVQGLHTKKALLVLSDGKDNQSRMPIKALQERIREYEVLVYALAVDDSAVGGATAGLGGFGGGSMRFGGGGGVDAGALRKITDDSGGRTEVVKGFKNLKEATAHLAEELSQQYLLSYAAPLKRDGSWHTIKVDVRKRGVKVRARTGYIAN
ncbi:MAG TPA: VWA domain-containing protein [Vicinamibacterales bacterium]|nr:VWA domain-containing protein [Vicinamibacterales bacterium]